MHGGVANFSIKIDEEEPFNPDYVEVDRVLDMSKQKEEGGEVGFRYSKLFILLLLLECCSLFGQVESAHLRRQHVGIRGMIFIIIIIIIRRIFFYSVRYFAERRSK